MSPHARHCCELATGAIHEGRYRDATNYLRAAIAGTSNRRAWSKLMLAIRELGRIVPANS